MTIFLWIKKHLLAVGAIAMLIALVTILSTGNSRSTTFEDSNGVSIPIPFLEDSSSLAGRVTFYGQRNGLDVYEVTYTNGETDETFVPDRVYLVHIPNLVDIVDASLDAVFSSVIGNTRNVDYFGYKYSDSVATAERANISASLFATRFPAQFFASAKARAEDAAHGNVLSLFEELNNVVFHKTDGTTGSVRLDPTGSLYVFVVNETGGAKLSVRRTGVCGDGNLDPTEQCDEDTDACTNECFFSIPIPFGSGGGVLSVNMTGPVSVEKNESFDYVATIKNESNSGMIISLNHTNPFEDGFIFTSENTRANCKEETDPICSNITLQAKETKTFTFPFSISQNAVCGRTTGSQVYVHSPVRPGEPFKSNFIYTTIACQPETDVSVDITAPPSIGRGEVITYTFVVHNSGANVATLVHTLDEVPDGLTFLPSQSDVSCSLATDFTPNRFGCNFGSIAAGQTITVQAKFQVSSTITCDSNITKTATLFVENDSNVSNNIKDVTTRVTCSNTSTAPLSMTVLTSIAATMEFTLPAQNLSLLQFRASATTDPILLKSVMFGATKGNLASLTNLSLWRDTTGDGVADTKVLDRHAVNSTGGVLVFSDPAVAQNRIIAANQSVVFEVRGGISSSMTVGTEIQLGFDTSLANFVGAVNQTTSTNLGGIKANGLCLFTCEIEVTTVPSTIFHIVASGGSSSSSISSSSSSHIDSSSSSSQSSSFSSVSTCNNDGHPDPPGEECDDGNQDNTDDCNNQCRFTVPLPDF